MTFFDMSFFIEFCSKFTFRTKVWITNYLALISLLSPVLYIFGKKSGAASSITNLKKRLNLFLLTKKKQKISKTALPSNWGEIFIVQQYYVSLFKSVSTHHKLITLPRNFSEKKSFVYEKIIICYTINKIDTNDAKFSFNQLKGFHHKQFESFFFRFW